VSPEQWIAAITAAFLSHQIECLPGAHAGHITTQRIIRLLGVRTSVHALAARPGSLKRAAIEAADRADQPVTRQLIRFGNIPFTCVPDLIIEAFEAQERMYKNSNRPAIEHYHVARHCLERCLGDPLCDLLLMIVLTLAASTETPIIPVKARRFEAGQRRDPALLVANLVTRMLWFLRPQDFPWDKDDGMVLRISEMTKKIGTPPSSPKCPG
jgi:hypothetical protein